MSTFIHLPNMKISLIGDLAFTGLLSYDSENNRDRFIQITSILKESNIVFANLEVPIQYSNEKNEYKSFIHYSLKNPTIDLLRFLNIGCVSLANNHIYDCKMAGLKATIATLDNLGISHTGAGWLQEHLSPVIIDNGIGKIGFIAYVDKGTNPKTEKFSELFINYFSIDKVIEDIKELKKRVAKIIISIHWGIDYSNYPTKKQQIYARELIDSGAYIIMGHHPHTIQPYERYKEGHVFYSLGGLLFGDYYQNGSLKALPRKTKKGIIVNFDEHEQPEFIGTLEKKGNVVSLRKFSFKNWSKKKLNHFHLAQKFPIIKHLILTKENMIDPAYEYFFGYYNNPIKRFFQLSNIVKIKRLFFRYINQKNKQL